jgi:hypothetical protein
VSRALLQWESVLINLWFFLIWSESVIIGCNLCWEFCDLKWAEHYFRKRAWGSDVETLANLDHWTIELILAVKGMLPNFVLCEPVLHQKWQYDPIVKQKDFKDVFYM